MRQSKYRVCAVNITCNPHPKDVYEHLLDAAFRLKKIIALHGDRHALLLQLDQLSRTASDGRQGVKGVLATFLDFDIDAPWFDTAELKVVKDSQARKIKIPASLRPNLAEFHFFFDVTKHILVCQARTLVVGNRTHVVKMTGNMLAHLFGELFSAAKIVKEFGEVEVTPIPELGRVDEILRSKLKKISIVLRAPNPDSIEDISAEILERMRGTHSVQIVESATARKQEVLEPDDRMKDYAHVAALNGHVDATIKTPSGTKEVSTRESPAEFLINRDARELDSVVIERASEYALDRIEARGQPGRVNRGGKRGSKKRRKNAR